MTTEFLLALELLRLKLKPCGPESLGILNDPLLQADPLLSVGSGRIQGRLGGLRTCLCATGSHRELGGQRQMILPLLLA